MKFCFAKYKVIIKISGDDLITVLNRIKSAHIMVADVQMNSDYMQLSISNEDLAAVKEISERNNCVCREEKEVGVLNSISKIKNLKSYLGGIICFCGVLYIASLFLWNIEIEGNLTITDEQIRNFMMNKKIEQGMLKNNVNCNDLEADIRNEFFDVTWVCAEIKGTNLIVHIKENYNKEIAVKEDKPYDLVSKHNSIITSIIARSGIPNVKAGDIVKEGDVLIRGTVDVYNEFDEKLFSNYVNADGDVYGKTEFYYEDRFPLKYKEKLISPNESKKYYVQIMGKTIGGILKDKENYYVVDENKKLKIFGNFYLPITIGAKTQYFFKEIDKKYNNDEAKQLANKNLSIFLQRLEEKEMQILEKDVNIYVGQTDCVAKGTITVIEPLAKVRPISYQEEGTTVVNERN